MSRVLVTALPFASRLHPKVGHAKDILARDRARAQKLLAGIQPHGPLGIQELRAKKSHHHHHHHRGPETSEPSDPTGNDNSIDVTDAGRSLKTSQISIAVTYTTTVKVGQSAQAFTLLIDTGSSNTWVGADTEYAPSSTSKSTRKTVKVSYGSGSFTGTEYTDRVELAADLVIDEQSIGVASSASGFSGVDGILGIGPVDLTEGTVSGSGTIPTVTDNLKSEGKIDKESIGISYVPTTGTDMANGELTFGTEDSSKYTGEITYVPITSTSPANKYWGIDQSLTYGSTTIMSTSAGIVDTGTTLLLLSSGAFEKYTKATGAKMDETTGLLSVTEAQFKKMKNLSFNIGSTTFDMTPNAQIWPRSLNTMMGGTADGIYLVVADMGSMDGSGLDFIDGFAFLQRFYSVYDTTNSQVGIAVTPHTNDTTN
ncbi:acid protease [Guyanagaster necrorhizus]|uniref:Acid protease n=1 Tax=Guyanagaster necrorhizus TaxID=856835 RepID=A0A9P7VQR0_9AGAR|nr:acid protease [Guyanagaster necrorhizus MCA 3950]KAG7445696.1 acid protease [Guyanagaster necrorhizus MCA 3950]